MRVVLDTNVLVSGLPGGTSPPARLVAAWQAQELEVVLSPPLLVEIERVLRYPRVQKLFGIDAQRIPIMMQRLTKTALIVSGTMDVNIVTADPTDNMVLACAKEAHAAVIVSGDTKHLLPLHQFQGIPILSPAEAMRLIESQTKRAA